MALLLEYSPVLTAAAAVLGWICTVANAIQTRREARRAKADSVAITKVVKDIHATINGGDKTNGN